MGKGNNNGFWSGAGSAIVSGIGSIGASAMSAVEGRQNQKRAYKYNKKLQQQAQEWQEKIWKMANEYSLPVNEIQRLLDAGVNPALAFSNAGASPQAVPSGTTSGGVGTPMPDIGNPGAAAVGALQNAKAIESQTDLNEALAEKARKEGDAAAASAGLDTSRRDFQELQNDVYRRTRDILVKFPALNYNIRSLEYGLAQNSLIRDNIYTANFPQENSLRLERMRLDNRNVEREYLRLGAEVRLLVAREQLTREQANEVSIRAQIALTHRYMAQWNENFMRTFNKHVYGDEYNVEGSKAFEDVVSRAKKEIANNLSAANLNEVSLSNDYGFEFNYGADNRFYNFENNRRSANLTRSRIYTESIGAIVNAGATAITAGSSSAYRGALIKSLRQTNRQFGYDGSLPPVFYDYSY